MLRWLIKLRSYLTWQAGRIGRAPAAIANLLFGTLWYDLILARGKQIHRGAVRDAARVVVYLIYPKNGLLESHFEALDHFLSHGYAPVVVSNVPLNESDRSRLLERVNHLIERPNYGYDFGGYRDGLLFLQHHLHALERLALMNDSVWFPVARADNWLPIAEAKGQDIVGAVANYFTDAADVGGYRDASTSWRYNTGASHFHYCSFALSFGPAVLHDARFLRFWKRLRLSNDKIDTVQRGEVGLGQWVVRSGHSHSCTLDLSRFDFDLDQLDDARLREVVANLIIPEDPALRAQKGGVLTQTADEPDARSRLKTFILQATLDTGPAYALLDFALQEKRHGFVKKSPLWLDPESAEITLRVLSEKGEDLFYEEALTLLRQRGLRNETVTR